MAVELEHRIKGAIDGSLPNVALAVGQAHRIVVERSEVLRPRESMGCAGGSGLVLPGPWAPDRHPIPFLLSAVHEAKRFADARAFLIGHVAPEEPPALGRARAESLRCIVDEDSSTWVELATEHGSIRDIKGYLTYLNAISGWECYIAAVDDQDDSQTAAAVEAFQAEYNHRFDRSILVDGICGEETLGAVFEVLRFEWDKWLYKHDLTQEAFDGLQLAYLDGSGVEHGTAGPQPKQASVDLLVTDARSLGAAEPSAELIYGSRFVKFVPYDVPLEPWGWERGPFTVVTDLLLGEVVAKETYRLRSTDGSFELSQSVPDDAVGPGLLQLRFFALPCDKAYDLTITVDGRETFEVFAGVPYNKLHALAVEGG